ncbi:putative Carbohydrate kinase, FGGY [uncultured Spirochaetota bacterium]|jgi:sugar (pentulose or hexulose) kinase|uniref:Putative Carbohydrate kinase, FGGY n=1 Tax=uncultured Spirochaetota bacterium TaxID=460511 RepID=A0A652ZXX8_9SPIR|nr:putative Carbohydrate kinase, FGGY [uncultured Spirochaetota bacterium]
MKKIMAVDIGTQSLKTSIYNDSLECLERHKVPYSPTTSSDNRVEIDAEIYWRAFVSCCRQLANKDVSGLVFSTLCPSLLLMDDKGVALTPVILHLDRRSKKESKWIMDTIGGETFRNITGNLPIPGGISITSMLWIKNQQGGAIPEGAVFGHVETFFMKRLTGEFYIDPSNASFTGLYETLAYSDWSTELLEKTGIKRNNLPKVLDSLSIAGLLLPSVAEETGLPTDLPVVIGANDTTCATAGAGIREPGMLLNTSGTVEVLVLCTDKPIVGPNHLIRTHAYKNRWLVMRTLGAGGASIEWFRNNFCKDLSYDKFYSDYLPAVLSKDENRVVEFAPYLTGDRHKLEPLKASFSNVTIDSSRDDFLYAVIRSNVNFLFSILPEWKRHTFVGDKIYHVGGGAGEAYTDFKRSVLKDYRIEQIGETAEKGAAIIGFEALGISLRHTIYKGGDY